MERKIDYQLLTYFIIWLVFGLIMLTSASSPVGHAKFGNDYFFIKRQLLLGVIPGLILFYFFLKVDYLIIKKYSLYLFGFTILLLILTLIPGIGTNNGTNAHSWLIIFGYSFQPSELAKLASVIYLAAYFGNIGKDIKDLHNGFIKSLIVGMIPIVLVILQPDVGTVAILFSIVFGMLYVAGARYSHIFGLALLGLVCLVLLIMAAPYRAARLTTFMHPELDPLGVGYQINQSFLAIGSGGIFGRGLGHSLQKFQYLPEVDADAIFAVIAEEMGFIFAFGLVLLITLVAGRCLVIARKAQDQFGRLLAAGVAIWFVTQSFLNIGAMVGALPLTGVPLLFVSHGGSALAIAMGAVGVLMNVSKRQTT